MPPARSRTQQKSVGLYIVVVSVLAAGAAIYNQLPGMAVLWLGIIIAAWLEPPAILSGAKDSSGYPSAANSGEETCLARSRFWRSLKFRMILPNGNWLPGWPILGAFGFALIAAAGAWQLPIMMIDGPAVVVATLPAHPLRAVLHAIPQVPFTQLRWAQALATFIICMQVTAARRVNQAEGSDCPGTRVNKIPALIRTGRGLIGVGGGILGGAAAFVAVRKYVPTTGVWAVPSLLGASATAAALVFSLAIAGPWKSLALDRWRFLAATSASWERNWVAVKQDKPSPRLLDHRLIGSASIEEFESPPSSGASVFYALTPKLAPAVGAGSRIAVLEMPDVDRKGQPIPGTRHPRRFQVITWPSDDKIDLTDPALLDQPEVAEAAIRSLMVWALDPLKIERPVLLSCSPITIAGRPAAWQTAWSWPDGPGLEAARALIGPIEAEAGSRVLVDSTSTDAIYFGALDSPTEDYTPSGAEPFDQVLGRLKFEDKWSQIWASVMKLSGGRAASQAERAAQMPTMTTRRKVGPAIVDEFSAPTSMGSSAFTLMGPKLLPAIGAGTVVAVLPMPELDRDGDPIAGSRHPLNFQVVTWRGSDIPHLSDPNLSIDIAQLWINCAVGNALDPMGIGRPTMISIEAIAEAGEPHEHDDYSGPIGLSEDEAAEPSQRGTMAWRTRWQPFGAADMVYLRSNAKDAIAGAAGCEVLIDQRALDSIFFGALTSDTTNWLPGERYPWDVVMENLANEDKWTFRWDQVYPNGKTNQPTIQPLTHRVTTMANGTKDGVKLERVAFIGRTGMDPAQYRGMEAKLATALQAAPFVSVTGYPAKGEPAGSRHAMGFYVTWSNLAVPANPGDMAFCDGAQWVIAGLMNGAFDAAFGATKGRRPEVVSSRTLTGDARPVNPARATRRAQGRPDQPPSGKHIWEVEVRLYGGVTLAEIRGVAAKLRLALGAPWLRIAPAAAGVTLFFGHLPAEVTLTNPDRDRLRLTALDWQQAFLDSGLSPSQGLLPDLTAMSVLPRNTNVQVLDFQCPPGLDPSIVRGSVEKLCTATANEFVEVRPGVGGADTMRLLSSKENPLPKLAAFDFDAVDNMEGIPFATDISGEYVTFNSQVDPHLLVAGSSGSGKAQPLTTVVPVPVSDRFPDGWATIGTLEVGDEVFAADGTTTRITGFSPVSVEPVYSVHFVDGQVVKVGANHLWKVGTAAGRAAWSGNKVMRRADREVRLRARAAAFREMARSLSVGTVAPLTDIAKLAGVDATWLHGVISPVLGTEMVHPSRMKCSQFDMGAVRIWAIKASTIRRGAFTLAGNAFTPAQLEVLLPDGDWLTARDLGDLLMGRRATRADLDLVKRAVRRSGAARRDGVATVLGVVYPVDEVLTLMAERIEYQAVRSDSGLPPKVLETIVSTGEMFQSVHRTTGAAAAGTTKNYAVRLTAPIFGPQADLPVPPLLLGLWLGDGIARSGNIASTTAELCTADDGLTDQAHLLETVTGFGYPARPAEWDADRLVIVPGLIRQLRGLGLLQNKHIPAIYLRASVEQRLALLRGLMDTDGSVGVNGTCSIDLCDETLISGVLELIRSLGMTAAIHTGVAAYTLTDPDTGITPQTITGTRWRINFTSTTQVFTLPRKAIKIKDAVRATQDWNYIEAITVGEPAPMRCLMVDHPEHLYLTDGFIPTHNSVTLQAFLHGWIRKGSLAAVIDPSKGAADFKFAEPHSTAFAVDVPAAAALMKALYAEVVRRKDMNAAAGVGSSRDLENPPKPYLIIIDEFTSLIGASPVPPPSDDPEIEAERQAVIADNGHRAMIGAMAGKIAREARSALFTLILGTQRLTAKMLDPIPGSQDLRTNLSRMLVGKSTTGEMQSALRAPFDAPSLGAVVPKGRALWETSAGAAEAVQGWYAPQSELAADLIARMPAMNPADRIDIGKFLPKKQIISGVAEDVSFLGEMDFSLDDFGLDLADSPAAPAADEQTPLVEEPAGVAELAVPASEAPVTDQAADSLSEVDEARDEPEVHPGLETTLLCLDVDGVLGPIGPQNPQWDGWMTIESGPGGSTHASSEMLAALCHLGAPMAWLTSWEDKAETAFAGQLPQSMPVLVGGDAHSVWWKIDALLSHLADYPQIRRIAFIDDMLGNEDDLGVTFKETLAESLDELGVRHLLLATDGQVGLTRGDIERLDVWLHEIELTTVLAAAATLEDMGPEPVAPEMAATESVSEVPLFELDDTNTSGTEALLISEPVCLPGAVATVAPVPTGTPALIDDSAPRVAVVAAVEIQPPVLDQFGPPVEQPTPVRRFQPAPAGGGSSTFD